MRQTVATTTIREKLLSSWIPLYHDIDEDILTGLDKLAGNALYMGQIASRCLRAADQKNALEPFMEIVGQLPRLLPTDHASEYIFKNGPVFEPIVTEVLKMIIKEYGNTAIGEDVFLISGEDMAAHIARALTACMNDCALLADRAYILIEGLFSPGPVMVN